MKGSGFAVVVAMALALASCANNDSDSGEPAQGARKPEKASVQATAPASAVASDSKLVLTGDGIVGAEVGRSWDEVSQSFENEGGYDDELVEGCQAYTHRNGKFDAMVMDNKIVRVEVTGSGVRTAEGIGVGSSLAQLKKEYGSDLVAERNPYEGADVQFVWKSKNRGLVFYMRDGKVWFMAGGGEAIRYPEGCH